MYLRLQLYATEVLKQDWTSLPIPDFNVIAKTTPSFDASRHLSVFCALTLLVAFDCPNRKIFLNELFRLRESSKQVLMKVLESYYSQVKRFDSPKDETIIFQRNSEETLQSVPKFEPIMKYVDSNATSAKLELKEELSEDKESQLLDEIDNLKQQLSRLEAERGELFQENSNIGVYLVRFIRLQD